MAISFPRNPSNNDSETVNGVTYVFDGTKWVVSQIFDSEREAIDSDLFLTYFDSEVFINSIDSETLTSFVNVSTTMSSLGFENIPGHNGVAANGNTTTLGRDFFIKTSPDSEIWRSTDFVAQVTQAAADNADTVTPLYSSLVDTDNTETGIANGTTILTGYGGTVAESANDRMTVKTTAGAGRDAANEVLNTDGYENDFSQNTILVMGGNRYRINGVRNTTSTLLVVGIVRLDGAGAPTSGAQIFVETTAGVAAVDQTLSGRGLVFYDSTVGDNGQFST